MFSHIGEASLTLPTCSPYLQLDKACFDFLLLTLLGLAVALINFSTKPFCSRLYKQEHIFTLQGYFVLAKTESTDL